MSDSHATEPHESDSPLTEAGTVVPLKGYEKEELAALIELLYLRHGTVPTAQDIRRETGSEVSDAQFADYIKRPDIKEYLVKERHVPLQAKARLTAKQLDWIRIVTDPTDMRPIARKMTDCKVTKTEVTSWLASPFYQQVLYEQSNRQFGESRYAVLRALQLEALGGNMTAIKTYLEITGDYSNKQEVNVNVETRGIVNAMVDILQEFVEPEILLQIVEKLEHVAIPNMPTASPLATLPAPPRTVIKSLPAPRKRNEQIIDIEEFKRNDW